MNSIQIRRYKPYSLLTELRIKAGDDCTLNVRVLQESKVDDIAPILFVHALAMDGDMWHEVANALIKGDPPFLGGIYALDCRGHGRSQSKESEFTTEQFANDIAIILDKLGISKAHIIGCSMGGTVGLAFAGRYPERVASITVIDATAWYGTQAQDHWEKRAQSALNEGMSSLVEFQKARWFSPGFLESQPALLAEAIDVFIGNQVPHYVSSCRMLGKADEREIIKNYAGPAMVIVGEDDYATPLGMAKDIALRINGADLVVIKGARHYTPLEAPNEVASCIKRIINKSNITFEH